MIGRRLARWTTISVLAAGIAPSASAAPVPELPPDLWAAVAQYVESIPTSTGAVAAGRGARGGGSGSAAGAGGGEQAAPAVPPLAPAARTALDAEGGELKDELERLATSPANGAPPQEPDAAATPTPLLRDGEPSALDGTATAVQDEPRLLLLLAFAAISGIVLATLALLRRRSRTG